MKQNTDTQKQNPMKCHTNCMFLLLFGHKILNMDFVKEMLKNSSLVMASGGKKDSMVKSLENHFVHGGSQCMLVQ